MGAVGGAGGGGWGEMRFHDFWSIGPCGGAFGPLGLEVKGRNWLKTVFHGFPGLAGAVAEQIRASLPTMSSAKT